MLKVWLAIFNFALLASDQNLSLPAVDLKRVSGDERVTVGDRITLELEGAQDVQSIIVDDQIKQEWVDAGFALFPPDDVKQPFKLAVVPLKAGELSLPSMFFKNSKAETFLRSNPFTIKVEEFKTDSKEPPPQLLGPVALLFPREFFVLLGAFVVLILLTLYLEWRDYKMRESKKIVHQKIKLPEDEEAMNEIAKLEKSEIYKKFQYKKIYFSLSEILKTYLGARYSFDAKESTSREVILALEGFGLGMSLVKEFDELFKKMDLIKFTETPADPLETQDLIAAIKKLIEVTKRPKIIQTQGAIAHEVR